MTRKWLLTVTAVIAAFGLPEAAQAQYLRVRDICRVKGQEENTLHGMGIVVGLSGTGDNDGPTMRALAKMLESMGNPLGTSKGKDPLLELKNTKNVAMVMVTANIPPEGARQGEQLNCTVSAVSAKSLQGGVLLMTPLVGPRPNNPQIYALAQGPLTLNEAGPPTVGIVHDGCRLEHDFSYQFDEGGIVTLVIDRHHAGFPTAYEIQEAINSQNGSRKISDGMPRDNKSRGANWENTATAVDPLNVQIRIPEVYQQHKVEFIAEVLDTRIALQDHDARIVIHERNGVIIVGDNVMVGRVAVTHRNISLQTGDEPAHGPLFEVDQTADTAKTRLKALVDALNALKVDSQSIIDIIKSLERSGNIYGRLIIE